MKTHPTGVAARLAQSVEHWTFTRSTPSSKLSKGRGFKSHIGRCTFLLKMRISVLYLIQFSCNNVIPDETCFVSTKNWKHSLQIGENIYQFVSFSNNGIDMRQTPVHRCDAILIEFSTNIYETYSLGTSYKLGTNLGTKLQTNFTHPMELPVQIQVSGLLWPSRQSWPSG